MPVESYTVTGLFEGYTLSELKARCLWKLKQKPGNYDKYSEASIEDALNDTLIEVARRLLHLRSFAIIEMKAGYSQYKPPSQMLFVDRAFFYQSASSYYELDQKSRRWLDRHKPGWRTQDGDPLIMYSGDSYGNLRKLGFYPTPDTDGESYTASPDTGIYASENAMSTTGNITGTAANTHATILTDSDSRTFSDLGVMVGMMLVNVTTGESGQISAVSGSTVTISASDFPSGFTEGDSFTILAGEYGVVTSWENDEQYLFTAEIGGMVDVSTIVNNVYIEFFRRPLKLQYATQYPEAPPEVHSVLADNVCWILKRTAPRGSNDYAEAQAGRVAFLDGLSEYVDPNDAVEDDAVGDYNL